ncbi:MAG: sigma-70 family RNA polymerase sigma factor [Deltaproteobacteria bacterium]|nr:MAG: sigma-70 family RNA polymerase sigma factor [Deltaproteobacteria bacterium]
MGADLLRDDPRCREAFRVGERWAMEAVYRHYLPLVVTVVCHGARDCRGLFNPAERDDAVQTVFALAFEERTRQAYNGVDPYSGFLRGVAVNVVRHALSRDQRFHRAEPPPHAPPEEALEARVIAEETAAHLHRFTDTLSPLEQTVLRRHFGEGASEDGLAAELGLTRYRCRKTIQTVQRRMIRYFEAHGIAPR